jgi:hypothetical protein
VRYFFLIFLLQATFLAHALEDTDMAFVIDSPFGQEKVKFHSNLISAEKSPVLYDAIQAQARRKGLNEQLEVHLDLPEPNSFLKILEFFSRDQIDDFYQYLPYLVEYADIFGIDRLGELIARNIEINNFIFLDKKDRKYIFLLGEKIKKVFLKNKEKESWQKSLFNNLVEYIINADLNQDKRKLKEIFLNTLPADDELVIAISTKSDALLAKQREEEALAWAKIAIKEEIAPSFKALFKKKPISFVVGVIVSSNKASDYMKALQKELGENYHISLVKSAYYCLPEHFSAVSRVNADMCLAQLLSCIMPFCGLQCLQGLTCGWFCCCCSECQKGHCPDPSDAIFDDRTSRFIYGKVFNRKSIARNCPEGSFYSTTLIKIKFKPKKEADV